MTCPSRLTPYALLRDPEHEVAVGLKKPSSCHSVRAIQIAAY